MVLHVLISSILWLIVRKQQKTIDAITLHDENEVRETFCRLRLTTDFL